MTQNFAYIVIMLKKNIDAMVQTHHLMHTKNNFDY